MTDDPGPLTATEHRERRERARVRARVRYLAYLSAVLGERGVANPADLAEALLAALTEWPDIDTGELCRCSCHPQLPSSDLHDFGFACNCSRTREQRRESFRQLIAGNHTYWQSPEGLQVRAADQIAQQELQAWLAQQQGVVIISHGGWEPEQWRGTVDGHSFCFRERGGVWDLEIDLRPTGEFMRIVDGHDEDGTTRYGELELERGEVIASGTVYIIGNKTNLVERAKFIVVTIRDHLVRADCTHQRDKLDAISEIIGTAARWCAVCGARLSSR